MIIDPFKHNGFRINMTFIKKKTTSKGYDDMDQYKIKKESIWVAANAYNRICHADL